MGTPEMRLASSAMRVTWAAFWNAWLAAASSPYWNTAARFSGASSCSCGAPLSDALAASVTAGRSSYSMTMLSAASCAAEADVATTSATSCPTYRTRPRARMSRCGTLMGYFTIGGGVLKCATSSPVKIALVPADFLAGETSMEMMRAWARSERTKCA
jgi:hypothetical protein